MQKEIYFLKKGGQHEKKDEDEYFLGDNKTNIKVGDLFFLRHKGKTNLHKVTAFNFERNEIKHENYRKISLTPTQIGNLLLLKIDMATSNYIVKQGENVISLKFNLNNGLDLLSNESIDLKGKFTRKFFILQNMEQLVQLEGLKNYDIIIIIDSNYVFKGIKEFLNNSLRDVTFWKNPILINKNIKDLSERLETKDILGEEQRTMQIFLQKLLDNRVNALSIPYIYDNIFSASAHKRFNKLYDTDKIEEKNKHNNKENRFTNKIETGIIELLKTNKQIVLTGAPGTGKTFLAKKIAIELTENRGDEQKQNIKFIQFHSSYDYTDFVEGIRPNKDGMFIRQDGTFKDFCKKAVNTEEEKFVFIIDEINRADIGKVFGELMYCLEPSYRGSKHKIKTQYQNMVDKDDVFSDGFYIPENVYIIGTMNDIDRSVESFDFALRRRFVWKEIEATPDLLDKMYRTRPLQAENLSEIKERMEKVNDIIKNSKALGLNKHFCLGGSYFYIADKKEFADLSKLDTLWKNNWNYRIEPLLREYVRGNDEDSIKEFIESCHNKYFNSENNQSEENTTQEEK